MPFSNYFQGSGNAMLYLKSFFERGISSRRFCFFDEKSLKGSELYNTKGRSDPLSGLAPVNAVTPDFRNTYCLIGMCSIDNSKHKPFIYNIG